MKIRARDFIFMTGVILYGSELIINVLLQEMRQEAWICFLLGIIPAIFLFAVLGSGENIYKRINGSLKKHPGIILKALYILFFILSAAYNINLLASFVKGYVLEETPKFVFILLFTLLCIYASKNGGENLIRTGTVFLTLGAIGEILNIILLQNRIDLKNFLPIGSFTPGEYAKGVLLSMCILLGDICVSMCFVNNKIKRKHFVAGAVVGGVFMLLIILRSIGTLGNITLIYTWPSHESLRIINSGNTLARVETTSVFLLIALLSFKVSLFISGAFEGIKSITASKGTIIKIICGAIIFVLANVIFTSGAEAMHIYTRYSAFVIIPMTLIIPAVLKLKKIFSKK